MRYINTETKEYPLNEPYIKALHPNTSFPVIFTPPYPYARVEESERPVFNSITEELIEAEPILVDGVWRRSWAVRAFSGEELNLRLEREHLRVEWEIYGSVQSKLDEFASRKGYDNIMAACSYSVSTVQKFKDDAIHAISMRDQYWAKCYEIIDQLKGGNRPWPSSFPEVEAEFPPLVWPS